MCGIAGEYAEHPEKSSVLLMALSIDHRGKEGFDITAYDKVCVGFSWLAIQDKHRRARQPFRYGDWLVWLNGEIYNHAELRKKIPDQTQVSHSDAETLAMLLHFRGFSILSELNGIFAIVAYNVQEQNLYLIRDRYGAKQLYYHVKNNRVLFASEPKAFLKHKEYSFNINKTAVAWWLTYQNYFNDEILFDGIKLVPPGTIFDCKNATYKKYHQWDFPDNKVSIEEIGELIKATCARQRPNEPIALWLSGGIDSSILAMEMHPEYCYTARWAIDSLDERLSAEKISSQLNTIHSEIFFSPKSIRHYEETIKCLDDLRVGAVWSSYVLNKLMSKHVRITVQGVGADEFFAGYPWRYVNPDYESVINRSKLRLKIPVEQPTIPQTYREKILFDINYFLQGLLIVGDRLSAAFGMEERVPFLDNELTRAALSIPDYNKNTLRQLYPELSTAKKGFTSPDWNYMYDTEILREYVDVEQPLNHAAHHSLISLSLWLKTYAP